MMLQVRDLAVCHGNILALDAVSLDVEKGEIVTIIGANGAGKSTLLAAIVNAVRPRSGSVLFQGEELTRIAPEKCPGKGVCLVPEGRRIFPSMSVLENLELGAWHRRREARRRSGEDLETVYSLFPILEERARQAAGTLSGGEQQMLAIGRALMAEPRLLLLDEPSLGLAPMVIKEIFKVLRELNAAGMTILLVEQDARIALKTAHRGYVLQSGRVALSGTGAELIEDELVKEIYFGKSI